jgi:hypothetical protein
MSISELVFVKQYSFVGEIYDAFEHIWNIFICKKKKNECLREGMAIL